MISEKSESGLENIIMDCFCVCFLGSDVDSCEFVVILLLIDLIFLFLLGKSL